MPKTDKIEYEKRLFTVQGWIVEGVQSSLIVQQIIAKGWCQKRQAERMLQEARERWVEFEDEDLQQLRKVKIQELKQLKRSLQEKFKGTPAGIRALMYVEKEIIKLEGLAIPARIEVTGKNGKPIQQHVTSIKVIIPGEDDIPDGSDN